MRARVGAATKEPELLIVFHSERMLQTLDLNTLVRILMEMYGRELRLRFRKMNQEERDAAEEPMEIVTAVRTRFLLIELWSDGSEVRREDLEERIIHEGQK